MLAPLASGPGRLYWVRCRLSSVWIIYCLLVTYACRLIYVTWTQGVKGLPLNCLRMTRALSYENQPWKYPMNFDPYLTFPCTDSFGCFLGRRHCVTTQYVKVLGWSANRALCADRSRFVAESSRTDRPIYRMHWKYPLNFDPYLTFPCTDSFGNCLAIEPWFTT